MFRAFAKRAQYVVRDAVHQRRAASTSSGARFHRGAKPHSVNAGGLFGSGEPVTYAGLTINKPQKFENWMSEFVGAQLWCAFSLSIV